MNKKYPWLPIDERFIPDIFSFRYPQSKWVRLALTIEMTLALLAVIGTLVLAILPPSQRQTPTLIKAVQSPTLSPSPSTY